MPVEEDYYALLGVPHDAGADDLKRAYRRRARELHPDANPGDAEAEARFKQVALAYEVLSDPERRARYDRFGPEGAAGGPGPFDAGFGGAGLGDLFDAVFGGNPFGGGRGGPGGPPRGPDLEVVVDLELRDAVFGARRPVEVRTAVACETCDATGAAPGTSPSTCSECGGTGHVRRVRQSLLGQMVSSSPCGRCGGLGQVIASPCPDCSGEGRRVEERSYTVDIPPGVDTGSTLRLSGRGAVGPRRGPAGDLYVHVRVAEDDRFVRDGLDLVRVEPITFAQATLGAHLRLETLDGTEDLVVPRGTPSGREFRLRHRGVPSLEGRGRGDLVVRVEVQVPTDLDAEAEGLLRRFAGQRGEDVAPEDAGFLHRIRSAFR